ncbi:hypothetical protein J7J84_00790 [bacterium]|nr:hypothetical protein [bacterium]
MRKVLMVIMVLLLFVAGAVFLNSCNIGDRTPKPGEGTVVTEQPPMVEGSSTSSTSNTGSAQPAAPEDTGDDDDEMDIFGD